MFEIGAVKTSGGCMAAFEIDILFRLCLQAQCFMETVDV